MRNIKYKYLVIIAWLLIWQPGIFAQEHTNTYNLVDSLVKISDFHSIEEFIKNNKSDNWENQLVAVYAGMKLVSLGRSSSVFLQPDRELFQLINTSLSTCNQLDRFNYLNFKYRIIDRYLEWLFQQTISKGNEYISWNQGSEIARFFPDIQFAANRFEWAEEHHFGMSQKKLRELWLLHFNLAYLAQNESEMIFASKKYLNNLEDSFSDSAFNPSPLIWLLHRFRNDDKYQRNYFEINNTLVRLSIDNEYYIHDRINWIFEHDLEGFQPADLIHYIGEIADSLQISRLTKWTLNRFAEWVNNGAGNSTCSKRIELAWQFRNKLIPQSWISDDSVRIWYAVLLWNQSNEILAKRDSLHSVQYGICSNEWIRFYLGNIQNELLQVNRNQIGAPLIQLIDSIRQRSVQILKQIPVRKYSAFSGKWEPPTCTEPIDYLRGQSH